MPQMHINKFLLKNKFLNNFPKIFTKKILFNAPISKNPTKYNPPIPQILNPKSPNNPKIIPT